MRKFAYLFVGVIFFFTSVFASEKNLRIVSEKSYYLNKTTSFYLYLPNQYSKTNKRFPVLYLLHGAYGSYRDWVEKTNVENLADSYNFIIVMPDGNPFGWYVDSPIDSTSRYESYIIKELIPFVDSHYRTLRDRKHRGICGLSMGGHGAISLAEKHPDLFGSASSLSGLMDITRYPKRWEIAKRLGKYSQFPERWKANSCYFLAKRLVGANVKLLIDVGRSDFSVKINRDFNRELDSLKIPHIYREFPGSHNWNYWRSHIGEHLEFHNKCFQDRFGYYRKAD